MSRVIAVEYASRKIRVNSILPGQLHTPMVEARLADQRTGGDIGKLLEQRQSRIPLVSWAMEEIPLTPQFS